MIRHPRRPVSHRGRIAAVRDRELRPLVADVLNNPAYGSGMNPLGMLNKLVCLPDSRELLRQRVWCWSPHP